MLDHRELLGCLGGLGLDSKPVIAHASLSAFGRCQGGAKAFLQALLGSVGALVMPTFTYKTMVTPESGPPNNGVIYGGDRDANRMVQPFHPALPADPLMGLLPEILRCHPFAKRTLHPVLSLAGIGADTALDAQTLDNPLAPVGKLAEQDGWVLLMGVDHTVNTSIHYGEKLAGRRQFIRWALIPDRIVECPGFPGCSRGFEAIRPSLEAITRRIESGSAVVQAIPLSRLFEIVVETIKKDPLALLCHQDDCERCNAVRKEIE